jgi:hypothetical protein
VVLEREQGQPLDLTRFLRIAIGLAVRKEAVRAKYCDKCDLLFSFSNEELAVAESVETGSLIRSLGS